MSNKKYYLYKKAVAAPLKFYITFFRLFLGDVCCLGGLFSKNGMNEWMNEQNFFCSYRKCYIFYGFSLRCFPWVLSTTATEGRAHKNIILEAQQVMYK